LLRNAADLPLFFLSVEIFSLRLQEFREPLTRLGPVISLHSLHILRIREPLTRLGPVVSVNSLHILRIREPLTRQYFFNRRELDMSLVLLYTLYI